MILKHISALARTLCDTLKMIVMWLLGKIFWALAILPPLAEAWHPGLLGSWLMIPAIFAVIYGPSLGDPGIRGPNRMLMFKNGVFLPLVYAKDDHGVWRIQERRDESDDEEELEDILASGDDPFYMAAFRSKKLKRRNRRVERAIVRVKKTKAAVDLEPIGCRDSVPGSCFTVGVDTDLRGAPPLGLTFDVMDPAVCVVASVSAPSLIHSWNQRCAPEEVVKPRDRLVKVNGLSRADAEGLAKVLAEGLGHKKKAHALLEFQHPLVVDVKLRKDGELPLGLSLHYALSENKIGGLCVKSVGEGLVKAKGLQIKEGHRVVAIDASEMGFLLVQQYICQEKNKYRKGRGRDVGDPSRQQGVDPYNHLMAGAVR
eukprot:s1089_g18.t1